MKEMPRTIAWPIFIGMMSQSFCTAEESAAVLDAVLVNGDVPGPSLWKVTQGDHVLWIMGTERMLPKKNKWRSTKAKAVIARSQEVLVPGEVKRDTDVGLLEGVKSIPKILKLQKNPDDATLGNVFDYPTYSKWTVLETMYIRRSQYVENWRPLYALEKWRDQAYEKLKLTTESVVRPVMRKAATLPLDNRNI